MKRKLLFIALLCYYSYTGHSQTWTTIASDAMNDGATSTLLDGTKLEYYYNAKADSLWFRIQVNSISATQKADWGANIMVNMPGGGSTFNFWGNTNKAAYHRLLTTWVTGSPTSGYTGKIGIADDKGCQSQSYTNLSSNNITIKLNETAKTITLGLKRKDLIPDAVFSGSSVTILVAGAVGSSTSWNDDIYSPTASMTLSKTTTNIGTTQPDSDDIQLYPNPVYDQLTIQSSKRGFKVNIRNSIGQSVISIQSTEEQSKINMSQLPAGMYMVEIASDEKTTIKNIIKN